MEQKVLEAAYGGLLHDIGKPLQRAAERSDLTEEELTNVPWNAKGGFPTHLHAGYTSRFLARQLGMYNEFESMVSMHHLSDSRPLASWIRRADWIASGIDRNDVRSEEELSKGNSDFRQTRLSSIFELVDFGKEKQPAQIELSTLESAGFPKEAGRCAVPGKTESVEQYQRLMDAFEKEVRDDPCLHKQVSRKALARMYGLFYKYLTTVPASTYEKSRTYVSLFDHLKLTSAIASCLAISDGKERFNMLEFDISGIQKFIFRVTEGGEAKKQIAKSLRGRSLLISMITDCITMSYLHEFGLSESNIIFNTGGGALLLLPDCEDYQERISRITDRLTQALYERFDTDITFVQASVSCDAKELEEFKISKAIDLKARLDEAKSHKYLSVMDESFFFTQSNGKDACELCGKETDGTVRCETCQTILALSDQLVKKEQLVLLFEVGKKTDFRPDEGVQMTLGNCTATLTTRPVVEKKEAAGQLDLNTVTGIESINHAWMGQTRYLAADVPMNKDRNLIPMDKICELARQDEWGDPKLGILKMDVDNLGAVFAYGLPAGTRSLSKYLTLSRMMEIFFGKYLPDICREISDLINPSISEETSNDTMFYINYAGGDDLVILGPAAGILELASAIRQDFSRYTNNRNLTISGGIFIQKPKQPVRFGVLQAEKYLDQSKELSGKNGITLIGTPLTFEEYGQMLDLVGSWRQAIEDGIYSRTGFYGLMKLLDVTNLPEFFRRIPLALYALKRNAKNQRFVDELKTRICAIADPMEKDHRAAMEKLRRLILEMKLTIMQTRDGGNDSMQEGRE